MYSLLRESLAALPAAPIGASAGHRLRRRRLQWPQVSRNVVALGFTSLFTDISSEMVSTVLPIYLVFYLRFTPLQFGFIDGLYQGVAALVRLAGGLVADRRGRHKEVAAAGYGLSAVSKLGLLAAGGAWGALAGALFFDRTGKGVRTAPRDALISLSTPRARLATAFGVHRALDTAGALLGPLMAFILLAQSSTAFDAIFVVSFCAALVGLGVLLLFVENREPVPEGQPALQAPRPAAISLGMAIRLLSEPRFCALVLAGGALGLATISDSFLYLGLQRRLAFSTGFFPLLYVATALCYFLLAVPAGRLADAFGRARTFVGGYLLLALVYLITLLPLAGSAGYAQLLIALGLFGAYYAATDGVLMALASTVLAPGLRGTGLALLTTVTSASRLLASILFGALWTWHGEQAAVTMFTVALAVAIALTTIALLRTERRQPLPAECL